MMEKAFVPVYPEENPCERNPRRIPMLRGKNAIVTGARRGIGRATVEALAQNGANVWACARKKDNDFETDMADLAERCGVWIKPAYFDLTCEEEIKEGLKSIFREKKSCDILANIAGIGSSGILGAISLRDLRNVFEVNFFSQLCIMQIVSRNMVRHKRGNIINVSSILGMDGFKIPGGYVFVWLFKSRNCA